MSKTKEALRGRPQMYPLTGVQINSILKRVGKGESTKAIAAALGVHEFAVLRIRRGGIK
jgi:hypothetical protein